MGQTARQTQTQTFVQLTFCSSERLIITSHYGLIRSRLVTSYQARLINRGKMVLRFVRVKRSPR